MKINNEKGRPLISYVITAYNIESYIRESVEAAFSQTYSPLEIVLSDDCSTDKTYEIMTQMAVQYKGPHKIVLNRNPQNFGITKHMNKAYLELATGEILIAAHGDDISLPDRAEKSYEFFRNNSKYTALSFSILSINEQGKEISELKNNTIVNENRYYSLDNATTNGVPNIPAPSRAFKRIVMEEFGPLHPSCPTEDEIISFRSLLLGSNAFLPDVEVYYRKHKGSSSNSENFSRFPLDKIYDQQLRDLEIAKEKSLITEEKEEHLKKCLKIGLEKRELTRNHFAKKNSGSLLKILFSSFFPIRVKLYYLRMHYKYKKNPEIYK